MKVLAVNVNGDITYCTVEPERRGIGRCNHIEHQNPGESVEDFLVRIEGISGPEIHEEKDVKGEISQEDINDMARKIDEIAGEKITADNFKDVISKLSPEKISQIANISFDAAMEFSLPIRDEDYEEKDINNRLYFATLPDYGISGNKSSLLEMFDKVGPVPTLGEDYDIKNSYVKGLNPEEYFAAQFRARDAMINKGVSTSKPGKCVYEKSIVEIVDHDNFLRPIFWHNLSVGDKFVDGSVVLNIEDWTEKECYEVKISGFDSIVLSHDHLLEGKIIVNGKIVDNLEHSVKSRREVMEESARWISVKDVYEFHKIGANIILNESSDLVNVSIFKKGKPQRVRCITTSSGFYETNGLIHHNTARLLFYAMSSLTVSKDCGGPYINAMECSMPEGNVCEKCARLTEGGKNIKSGELIGGWVSTNISEALTQLSMKQMHVGSSQVSAQLNNSNVIMNTLEGWSSSPIIKEMSEANTTKDRRNILYNGLKEQYDSANIKQDEFNLMIVAKRMTSYKRTQDRGLVPISGDNDLCSIVSLNVVGNAHNLFKTSELQSGYKHLTTPMKQNLKTDAANQILR